MSNSKLKRYIDPPSGWRYGFPKEFPDGIKDVEKWLVKNGYPQILIDKCKSEDGTSYFVYRIFQSNESR